MNMLINRVEGRADHLAEGRVIGRNKFCGPAALSLMTAKPTHVVARELRQAGIINRTSVRGMSQSEMLTSMCFYGVYHALTFRPFPEVRTVRSVIDEIAIDFDMRFYLLQLEDHWLIYCSNFFVDNNTRCWVDIRGIGKLLDRRLVAAWHIDP